MTTIQECCIESEKLANAIDALSDAKRAIEATSSIFDLSGLLKLDSELSAEWDKVDVVYRQLRERDE